MPNFDLADNPFAQSGVTFACPPSPAYSFEPRHVAWARAHDWFLQDNGNGSVTVQTPVLVGAEGTWYMEAVTFLSPRALREWAGY